MKPQRIQRKRTKGWKMPPNTVYVGRPTEYGNPFKPKSKFQNLALWIVVNGVMSEDDVKFWYANGGMFVQGASHAVELYQKYVDWRMKAANGKEWIEKLRGKNLSCWCPLDEPCHADVLLKIANEP